ncbi:hypothetical protein EUTSA_v10000670mg [Eutrema salsugineum]|uniref:RNase H type-1 domain-containing protein n=1 Tax=Eutrema salsugineum TaxID=72664 RepID=V4M1P7_EUTSA|nr:hypothetical protein EUTSA_v10000670mg [Eutrema salsugineum]
MPKVKQLLWRAAVDALPVRVELVRRRIQVDFGCKICGNPKTITHVLKNCQFARKVWDLAPLKARPHLNMVLCLDFLAFILSLLSFPLTGISATSLPVWICWNLWTTRNHQIFSNTTYSAGEVITKALEEANAWQEAQTSLQKLQAVLCNIDAAWHTDSGSCGMGFTFRLPMEKSPVQHSTSHHFISSALAAEAWALREALISAIDAGYESLQVLSDSQILMNLINS